MVLIVLGDDDDVVGVAVISGTDDMMFVFWVGTMMLISTASEVMKFKIFDKEKIMKKKKRKKKKMFYNSAMSDIVGYAIALLK